MIDYILKFEMNLWNNIFGHKIMLLLLNKEYFPWYETLVLTAKKMKSVHLKICISR